MSPEIRNLLDRGAQQPRWGPDLETIAEGAGRLRRRRRVLASGAAVLAAVAGIAIPMLVDRLQEDATRKQFSASGTDKPSGGQSDRPSGTITTYRDQRGGWEVQYPASFVRGQIPNESGALRISLQGIWIANFSSPEFEGPSATVQSFPDDGVMVKIFQMFGGPVYIPDHPDSSFPISLHDLRPAETVSGVRIVTGGITANGEPYTIQVLFGPEATEDHRQAAAEIVSSMRFLPLEEGTIIGQHTDFFVLDSPDAYPVGSVTRFDPSDLPSKPQSVRASFYLVHVPEGFYALAWPDDFSRGYKDCGPTFSSEERQFTCPNGARWALDGSVVTKPDPSFPQDPLRVLLVRISLDGHLLVTPVVGMDTSQIRVDLELTSGAD